MRESSETPHYGEMNVPDERGLKLTHGELLADSAGGGEMNVPDERGLKLARTSPCVESPSRWSGRDERPRREGIETIIENMLDACDELEDGEMNVPDERGLKLRCRA